MTKSFRQQPVMMICRLSCGFLARARNESLEDNDHVAGTDVVSGEHFAHFTRTLESPSAAEAFVMDRLNSDVLGAS